MRKIFCIGAYLILLLGMQTNPCRLPEVASAPPPLSSKQKILFSFQVETLSYKTTAEALVKSLKSKGYPAYISVLKTQKGKVLYKIRIGEYKTRAEAEAAGADFSNREKKSFFIVRSIGESSLPAARKKTDAAYSGAEKITVPAESPAKEPLKKAVTKQKEAAASSSKKPSGSNLQPQKQQNIIKGGGTAEHKDLINITLQESIAPGETYYTVQVVTELRKAMADSFLNELIKKGFPAYIVEKKTQKGKMLYKVRIGKYKTKLQAKEAASYFYNRENKSYLIVRSDWDVRSRGPVEKAPVKTPREQKGAIPVENNSRPESVKKIFAYRGSSGVLNLTNSYQKIPKALLNQIEYISVFPVRFLSPGKKAPYLFFEIEGAQKEVRLAGIKATSRAFPDTALAYFEQTLKNAALRLKYSPGSSDKDGIIFGRLYLKEGTYINLEMVRRGIASCSPETVALGQREEFIKAGDQARKEKAGIWATTR